MDMGDYGCDPMEGVCEQRDNDHFDFTTTVDILADKRTSLFRVTSVE